MPENETGIEVRNQETELAQTPNIHDFIRQKAGAFESIPYIKILAGTSQELSDPNLKCRPGEFILKPDNLCLGMSMEVVIGPWRISAKTIENGKITRVDYNLSPRSRYLPEKNDWVFPDGLTPTIQDIGNAISDGKTILNEVGYDILFFLPVQGIGVVLWLKNTAISMSKILQYAKMNIGKSAILFSEKAPSKTYNWNLPHLRPSENPEKVSIPASFQETVKQFLNPGVMSISSEISEVEKPR